MAGYRRMIEYAGQRDRGPQDPTVVELNPVTQIEIVISDISDKYKAHIRDGTKEPFDSAVNDYLNVRNNRHDLWVELLEVMMASKGVDVGDIRVDRFVGTLLDRNFELPNVPDSIARKTPDILFCPENSDTVIVGDVAVAVNAESRNRDKFMKYDDVMTYFKQAGLNVVWKPLIVDVHLDNVQQAIDEFVSCDLADASPAAMTKTKKYHTLCNVVMENIRSNTTDRVQFERTLQRADRSEDSDYHFELPALRNCPQIEAVNPVRPESEVIEMIKEETIKMMRGKYFDDGYEETEKAFDELIDSYKDKPHTEPKSTLKVVSNCHYVERSTNHDLILDYIEDISRVNNPDTNMVRDYVLDLLPSSAQLEKMKGFTNDNKTEAKTYKVYGKHQYSINRSNNPLTMDLKIKLTIGKKNANIKKPVEVVDPAEHDSCVDFIKNSINYYGSPSNKPPYLTDTWDAHNNVERENTGYEKAIYDYVRKTNGAQLGHALSNFYSRLMHLSTSLGSRDNVFVPPNSSFIAVIPKEHAPISKKNCDIPLIFITRSRITDHELPNVEAEHVIKGLDFVYYVSKLCRLNMDKISCWDQAGFRLVACCSHLLSRIRSLESIKSKVIGTLTYYMLDSHQKTSEYLDLLKYISFMPYSDISRLSHLVLDKMNLMMKTRLDVWTLLSLRKFMLSLSDKSKLNARKPRVELFNAMMTRESLGMVMNLPSFFDNNVRHSTIEEYIEEVTMINIVRPKHLYGSQFMDASISKTAEWNNDYEEEKQKYGEWVTTGYDDGDYPFNAKFAFCTDAIIYAQRHYQETAGISVNKVNNTLNSTNMVGFMHKNCSLRGATKEENERTNDFDFHTTSMEACLNVYNAKRYVDKECTVKQIAADFLNKEIPMSFAMSEKDQRGGGRPISTPTLGSKAALMMVEKPEQSIGTHSYNNILVEGKNKLKEQSESYKSTVANASIKGYKMVFQLTEDQTKFSENDNIHKFKPYIQNNTILHEGIRKMQLMGLDRLVNRNHLVHRLPKSVINDPKLSKHINHNRTGVKAIIGWPQGMLNNISTSIHTIADHWITDAYNKAFPESQIYASGLVHSDDSWTTVACNEVEDFQRFAIFRMLAKKMFCLKLNEKKLWGSRYLGELVSNYNINGNVHLPISKTIANSFGNLMYQNWNIDVHNQISALQQAYRNGATIPTLIMLKTILRQQLISSYQVKGLQRELLSTLPVDLGGFPSESAFELAVCGVNVNYANLYNFYDSHPEDKASIIVRRAMTLSVLKNKGRTMTPAHCFSDPVVSKKYNEDIRLAADDHEVANEDYATSAIAHRGDIFTAVKHIMPKSRKITKTVQAIEMLPFESDDLEMIVTRPTRLSQALGHLKSQTSTILYKLASEHYTQSTRRLAVSQAIQSSGKTVRLLSYPPMTMNDMLELLLKMDKINLLGMDNIKMAFIDECPISGIVGSIVNHSELTPVGSDKRKIINKMPNVVNKFTTISRLQHVLLHIIDIKLGTDYVDKHALNAEPIGILDTDANLILKRFSGYFATYTVKYACNLIMQQYLYSTKSRLWMQPFLRTDSELNFLSDLYGKTLSSTASYRVEINNGSVTQVTTDSQIVNTLYSVEVLNTVYKDKFIATHIGNKTVIEALNEVDHAKLNTDDYLKFAIMMYHLNDERRYLDHYDRNKMYSQYYIERQRRDQRGVYVGDFKCKVKYGRTVMIIDSRRGKVSLEVSRAEIRDITSAMQIFVKRNFPQKQYKIPQQWGECQLWVGKDIYSELYLCLYANQYTYIKSTKSTYSIPISINNRLVMERGLDDVAPIAYHIDANLRVVEKEIHAGNRTDRHRVGAAKQNMSVPLVNQVVLIEDLVEEMHNSDLIKDGLIFNVTMRRYYANSKERYQYCVSRSMSGINSKPLLDMYINIFNQFHYEIKDYEINEEELIMETIYYDILGDTTPASFLTQHMDAAPESLDAVQAEFEICHDDRTGSLVKHSNLKMLFCKIASGSVDKRLVEDTLLAFIKSATISTQMADMGNYGSWEDIVIIDELTANAELNVDTQDPSLIVFIIGSGLNSNAVLQTYDLVKMFWAATGDVDNPRAIGLAKRMVNEILRIVTGERYIDPEDNFRAYVREKFNF
ncbi:MAG: RNA-dependent RNA polymerase [Fushun phasmavirus 1]|uniref:RNA-directed RNA polymerase L n=1 Tax=Fushun phasmavirus 1 TaxID=2905464 RepID=A0A8K1XHD3_9VIRU|nr:MAG: RNA-dependent RNA polymerase [Fushun phasmavirus 1]UHR49875.1 MAG: RNA-dependent RNA polymerase [Fushun phasmavirus 1]UHR49922.1 MAG: RNA-dependent RNA polymerase [Fushun phasmavirus 1]